MVGRASEGDKLLTPAEVAALFRVDPKTVTRWAKAGKLTSIRTLGGHRRYRAAEVYALVESTGGAATPDPQDAITQSLPPTAVAPRPRQPESPARPAGAPPSPAAYRTAAIPPRAVSLMGRPGVR